MVEKLGDNTVKIVRNGQIIRLPKKEYDSLQPINPSRFGRFSGRGGAEQRDEALELGLRLVLEQASPLQQSLLTENDIAALAQTNRIVLEQALSSNANNFRASRAAKAQFLDAIRRGDRETVALFERFDAPFYLTGPPGVDVLDPLFIQALNAYAERNENDLFERLFHRFDHNAFAPDAWLWEERREDNLQIVFETVMRQKNMHLLRFLLREMPDEEKERGMEEFVLVKASEFNWEEAVRLLASTVLLDTVFYRGSYLSDEHRKTPLVYWIRRKNLRMIIEILRRRDPEEQRAMLTMRPDDDSEEEIAIVEALRMGPDALDIVKWILSKSVRGDSVCGNDTLALITALHYRDPLGNKFEAPTEIVAQIIRDYATNYGAPPVAAAAAGGGGGAAAAAAAAGAAGIFSPQANVEGFSLVVDRKSPLLRCCYFRKTDTVECARLILDAGADPNEMDYKTDTPLIEACRLNNIPLARLLLQRGANPNLGRTKYTVLRVGKVCETPLLLATLNNSREMIELLLNAGANPLQRVKIKEGDTRSSVDFLAALLLYDFYEEEDIATMRFLIQEKRFRSTDINFLYGLLSNLKKLDAANNVLYQEGTREVFLTALEGIPPAIVSDALTRLMQLILSDKFDKYAQLDAGFVFSIDPSALTLQNLFDAILDEDVNKVAFILSKFSRERLRQVTVYQKSGVNFSGSAVDFALQRRRSIDPARSRDDIETILLITKMIQEK
jgi:hypothetical protein